MKNFSRARQSLYEWAEWLYVGATALSALLSWVNGVSKDDHWVRDRPIIWSILEALQKYSIYMYVAIGSVVVFCFIYRKYGDPWVMEKLKLMLDQYQYKVFSENGAPADHDRVTIFRYKQGCYFARHWSADKYYRPWGNCPFGSSYLIPFMRSGHLSQNTKAIFYAPDDSDKAEGVAALAWAKNRAVIQQDLPLLTAASSDYAFRKYASKTNSNELMVRKYIADGKVLPRSIAAIPIDTGGKIWGVVVLDSRSSKGVTDEAINNYQLTIALIGHLLEKA